MKKLKRPFPQAKLRKKNQTRKWEADTSWQMMMVAKVGGRR